MTKVDKNFIINQYSSGIDSYSELTKKVGLWESEKYVFERYLERRFRILDLGCGTGRTTFPLFHLGFHNIVGVDLTPKMVEMALKIQDDLKTSIEFQVGDATQLDFDEQEFDAVIFSFNGLMSIPTVEKRLAAVAEINRVLKDNGMFIFTTHDRNEEEDYIAFWAEEAERWETGNQNPLLYEYGDLITTSKNETAEIFIHIPDQSEVRKMLSERHFRLIETFYRNERFEENEMVKAKSGECRFWIAQKM